MPLYVYQCEKCGHQFEQIQKFSDREIKKCPECGGKVEKMITSAAVQFKGSGWYATDYAQKPAGSGKSDGDGAGASSAEKAEKKESAGKSDSKSESKAESKAESKTEGKSKGEKKAHADAKSG